MPSPKSKPVAEYMALSHAAEILGKSKHFVKRAVERGLIRASTEPFKSNLNKNASSFMLLVNAQDIRDVIAGNIDLSVLENVRTITKKELPKNMEQFTEMLVNLTQSVEQIGIMVAALMERVDNPPVKRPARKEVPDV